MFLQSNPKFAEGLEFLRGQARTLFDAAIEVNWLNEARLWKVPRAFDLIVRGGSAAV
jgi:hypothetical protein